MLRAPEFALFEEGWFAELVENRPEDCKKEGSIAFAPNCQMLAEPGRGPITECLRGQGCVCLCEVSECVCVERHDPACKSEALSQSFATSATILRQVDPVWATCVFLL